VCAALAVACAAADDPLAGLQVVSNDPSDASISGLDAAWSDRFSDGDALFDAPFRTSTGLGPVYIRHSCASCHADDARGPGVVEKFVVVGDDGMSPAPDQSMLPWGHTARPLVAGGATTPLDIPDVPDLLVTIRAPTAVFGRGYIEAIDESEIFRVADEQAIRDDDISGRPSLVPWQSEANPDARFHDYGPGDSEIVGRFGLKARIATLDEFAADALQGDMSITNPLRPTELPNPDALTDDALAGVDADLEAVNLLGDYLRLLDIPARAPTPGAALFESVGCAVCHVPALFTQADWPVPQLAAVDAPVYTDLLLHDMGPGFADGLEDAGGASSTEWKTAPLVGLRHLRSFLHDGRASTVEEAIVAHGSDGSEATAVVDAFEDLSDEDRLELLLFVESL
jgi:CxxC motif-containing protein (DUF1111 family)